MKKIILALLLAAICVFLFTGCSASRRTSCEAILRRPDGAIVKGPLQDWNLYSNGNVSVQINDCVYYTHSSNVVIMQVDL